MKTKVFGVLMALMLALSLCLVVAAPAGAANAPVIDGIVSAGEWDDATVVNVASSMGTVSLLPICNYLYVLFQVNDTTDARKGENLHGNDQTSVNINPTDTAPWGLPCDIIFQFGADAAAWGGTNSGDTDGWHTDWAINGVQIALPADVETKTLYSGGTKTSELKLPISTIGASPGAYLHIGGAIDVGDMNSYVYPTGLVWDDESTYAAVQILACAPPPVGGQAYPVSRPAVLAPYIILVLAIAAVIVIATRRFLLKRNN